MLSQLPGNTWHVRRLPCENVPVLTEELDECLFLFGVECCRDMSRSSAGIGRVDVSFLRIANRLESRFCGGLLGSQQITRVCSLLEFLQLHHCHLSISDLRTFLKTFFRFFPIARNSDHTFRARHLQFEIHNMVGP